MTQNVAAPTQSLLPTAAVDLDRLLAPIFLHPDRLVARMPLRALNPLLAGRLDDRPTGTTVVKGRELQDAATREMARQPV